MDGGSFFASTGPERSFVVAVVKLTAIIRTEVLEPLETRLKQMGVPGITVSTVKGFGECANFSSHDWKVSHARVELFVAEAQAEELTRTICELARTGEAGDGVVAVLPVDRLVRIRTGEELRRLSPTPAPAETSPEVMPRPVANPPWMATALAWLILVLSVSAGLAAVFVASRHQMHYLAALFGAIVVLCGALGGLAFTRRGTAG